MVTYSPSPYKSAFLFIFLCIQLPHLFCMVSAKPAHNYFEYGKFNRPHPQKVDKGGEDAFYASNTMLAVADGVGGWNNQGVDPSKYSKKLCALIPELLNESSKYHNNPKEIIKEAANRNEHEGSSTFVIVELDKEKPLIRTAQVGDSLYVIFRKQHGDWMIAYESTDHQMFFNRPYQIGKLSDPPEVALEFQHQVMEGDIIFVASDGLFDNIDSKMILKELIKYHVDADGNLMDPQKTVNTFGQIAYILSLNQQYYSPFARKAMQQLGAQYIGGKSDDITILVGQVRLKKQEMMKDEL